MASSAPIFRHYETVILVRPDAAESVKSNVKTRVGEIINNAGGRVARWETWGKRRLAYEIRKQNKAHYLYSNFVSSQDSVYEIERNLRIMEPVLKFQTIRLTDQVDLEAFPFEKEAGARTALYLSPEEAAAIERSYQREREWAEGGRYDDDAPARGASASRTDEPEQDSAPAPAEPATEEE